MRNIIYLILCAAVLICGSANANGTFFSIQFKGTVTYVSPNQGGITAGDAVSGLMVDDMSHELTPGGYFQSNSRLYLDIAGQQFDWRYGAYSGYSYATNSITQTGWFSTPGLSPAPWIVYPEGESIGTIGIGGVVGGFELYNDTAGFWPEPMYIATVTPSFGRMYFGYSNKFGYAQVEFTEIQVLRPVPEPGSSLMFLVGVGFLGCVACTRRTSR